MHSPVGPLETVCNTPFILRTVHDLPSALLQDAETIQSHYHEYTLFRKWKPIVLAVLCFIVILTVSGNALICVAAVHNRHLRHPSNVFFIALAITNLLYASTVMLFTIVYNCLDVQLFTDSICITFQSLDILFCTASNLHLAAIALDRFVHVHSSVTYSRKFTTKIHVLVILFLWTLSALTAFLPLEFNCHRPEQTDLAINSSRCPIPSHVDYTCHQHVNFNCALANAMLSFLLPLVFMIIVYGRLFQITRQHLTQIKSQKPSVDLIVEREDSTLEKMDCEVGPSPDQSLNSQAISSSSLRGKFYLEQNDDGANLETSMPTIRQQSDCSQNGKRCSQRLSRSTHDTSLPFCTMNSLENGSRVSRQRCSLSVPVRHPTRTGSESVRSFGALGKSMREPRTSMVMRMRTATHNEHKAAITLAVILGSFILCWMPYFSVNCLAAVFHCIYNELYFGAIWLGYFNTCLNPVIYSLFNNKFRRACTKLLCIWRHGCRGEHEQYGLAKLRYCGDATIQVALERVLWNKEIPALTKVTHAPR
ncbi:Dopamine D1 receptor [Fasciola hepatica]|uniref:Dopamine D1 receptor n=1 Tax=Fasciola hepatica TaxID=6192 RepID=A0A4E0RIT8_FASHE|nr:Dopamine D1 receptor [Fasciola hepatica]